MHLTINRKLMLPAIVQVQAGAGSSPCPHPLPPEGISFAGPLPTEGWGGGKAGCFFVQRGNLTGVWFFQVLVFEPEAGFWEIGMVFRLRVQVVSGVFFSDHVAKAKQEHEKSWRGREGKESFLPSFLPSVVHTVSLMFPECFQ